MEGRLYRNPEGEAAAPRSLAALDEHLPGQIKQGNYLKADYDDDLLGWFRAAYEEANRP